MKCAKFLQYLKWSIEIFVHKEKTKNSFLERIGDETTGKYFVWEQFILLFSLVVVQAQHVKACESLRPGN